jgi:hypothetical protein
MTVAVLSTEPLRVTTEPAVKELSTGAATAITGLAASNVIVLEIAKHYQPHQPQQPDWFVRYSA